MWEVSMEGPDRDQRGNPQGMFMASIDMEPFTKYLGDNGNKITIDTIAEMLANQLDGNDANEDELAQFIEHLISHGATVNEDESEEAPTDEGAPIDDNGHVDTEEEASDADAVDESDDDSDWYDEDEDEDDMDDEDLDYDKIASYAKDKPVANEPASDERVKSNKKPCADEPGKEVASDEKCKDKKGACAVEKDEKDDKEDMMKFSDESLKNIVGVLADRIL